MKRGNPYLRGDVVSELGMGVGNSSYAELKASGIVLKGEGMRSWAGLIKTGTNGVKMIKKLNKTNEEQMLQPL